LPFAPRVPGPSCVDPSLNIADPVGTPDPVMGTTVAVNVTVAPRLAGVIEEDTVVVVAIIATTTDTAFEVEGAKFASPEYCAMIESVPNGGAVISVATPDVFNVCGVPSGVVPERNVTEPVGVVVLPEGPVTVAVKVTSWSGTAVRVEACRTVVGVG